MTTEILAHAGSWGPHAGPGFIAGPILFILFLALIATVSWLVVRSVRSNRRSGTERAVSVLAERFARGELSTDEYHERLSELRESG